MAVHDHDRRHRRGWLGRSIETCRHDEPRPGFVDEIIESITVPRVRAGDAHFEVFRHARPGPERRAQRAYPRVLERLPFGPRFHALPGLYIGAIDLAQPGLD